MHHIHRRTPVVIIMWCIFSLALRAQTELIPLEHQLYNRLGTSLYNVNHEVHTSIQPYELKDISGGKTIDSIMSIGRVVDSSGGGWLYRKIYSEHLLEVTSDEYRLYADFFPDLDIGRDVAGKRNTNLNTRGFAVGGSVSDNFSFVTEFYENQAAFPNYIDAFARQYSIIPGQAVWKPYGSESFDFAYANAVLSYRPSRYLGIQGGQGKNFIGDGYRSMLLSDVPFNYPFLKLTADVWKIKYMMMWAEFQDLRNYTESDRLPYQKKSGVFQYLDINLSSRVSLGLFEAVIWLPLDSTYQRGLEWNYLNPIIFLQPVNFSLGSPDNMLVGANLKYQCSDRTVLYGQLLLDELTVKEYFTGTGYWANKYGVQLGVKSFGLFNVRNLFVQTEFNCASPYTYSHLDPLKNYGHYNQSLADPLGANFYESVSIAQYSFGRVELRAQLNLARYGEDSSGVNYGKDIYKSYTSRVSDYGNYITQGVKSDLLFADFRIAYVFNPLTNLRLEAGTTYRRLHSNSGTQEMFSFSFGIRSSFRNLYYDF